MMVTNDPKFLFVVKLNFFFDFQGSENKFQLKGRIFADFFLI